MSKSTSRQQTYISKMKEKGFAYVAVWVPVECSSKIRKSAEKMRRDFGHITTRAKMIYSKKDSKNG